MLTMEQGIITYRETQLPVALRLFTGFLGLSIAIGMPYAWMANASLSDPPLILVLVSVVALVSVGFGGFFVFLGLISASEMRIDPALPQVTRIRRGPILNDTTLIPRSAFGQPEVRMKDSEDGPFPILRLPLEGRRRIEMVCFDSRAEAEAWRNLIAKALKVSPATPP